MSSPPATRSEPVVERFHDRVDVIDDYRWLEDGGSAETRAWVDAQNAYTRAVLDAAPQRERIRQRLDVLLTAGSVGTPTPGGRLRFYMRRDGRQDQAVLMAREGDDGAERALVDPNRLSARGVVALDWWWPTEDGRLLAYGLSEGGTELSVLRVLDVGSGNDVPGEEIPYTRACTVAWLPDNSGFYYTRYPTPGSVPAGEELYNRHVFFHRLGQDWQTDADVFGQGMAREDWPVVSLSADGRWLLVEVSQGSSRTEVYVQDRQAAEPAWVPVHTGVEARADGEIVDGVLYLRSNEGASNYQVWAVDPSNPTRDAWRLLIPEAPDRVLQQVLAIAGRLAVVELRDATSRVVMYDRDGQPQASVELPSLGSVYGLGGKPDAERLYLSFTSFAQPLTAYSVDPETAKLELFERGDLPPGLDPSCYSVTQVWYTSKDGTRVSMFVVHRTGLTLDGNAPTVLTGYGGFNISRTPMWISVLPMWLDAGGVYALPNLRGGGEYGEDWHRAGMLGNKQNVFDDFLKAADWLIEHGYTKPERLAITGGSNGGLLVGAALTQRPELFRAVVCSVPLLDMLRYHDKSIARLWIPELGSAEDPEQFEWLRAYSPYHNVPRRRALPGRPAHHRRRRQSSRPDARAQDDGAAAGEVRLGGADTRCVPKPRPDTASASRAARCSTRASTCGRSWHGSSASSCSRVLIGIDPVLVTVGSLGRALVRAAGAGRPRSRRVVRAARGDAPAGRTRATTARAQLGDPGRRAQRAARVRGRLVGLLPDAADRDVAAVAQRAVPVGRPGGRTCRRRDRAAARSRAAASGVGRGGAGGGTGDRDRRTGRLSGRARTGNRLHCAVGNDVRESVGEHT